MKDRGSLGRIALFSGVILSLSGAAAWARRAPEASPIDEADLSLDPATGSVLLDLDDAASDDEWARARDAIARGVAPYDFVVDDSPRDELGAMLSDEAELYRLDVPASEVDDVLHELAADADVEVAEVERSWSLPEGEAFSASELEGALSEATSDDPSAADREGFAPNDPYYRHQWHLDLIGMPRAWQRACGDGVVVAVVDTGVAYEEHDRFLQAPDLAGTRFAPGYDFVDGDATPDDEHGHGTHVAGTIAQATNNGLGVAGVAPGATIMPIRVLDRNGSGSWGSIAAAIRFAADHGAHVINMSLGGGSRSRTIERAINHAHARGVVVVAAAGNTGHGPVEYPARHDHVIAVSSVRYDREIAPYSSRGDGLDIAAPGGDLRVDQNGDGLPDGVLQNTIVGRDPRRFDYLAWQGTSMAAPHVAGVAALVRSTGVTDPDAIERTLLSSAQGLGDRSLYGAGLVRADAAISRQLDDRGMARGAWALGLAAIAFVSLQRRKLLGLPHAWLAALVGFVFAGGLAFLPVGSLLGSLGMPVVAETLAEGLSGLGALGTFGVMLLAAAPVALTVLAMHKPSARPFLVGLGFASAATLMVEALDPSVAMIGGWLAGPALVLAATVQVALARQVSRSERSA
jgi:serine protease